MAEGVNWSKAGRVGAGLLAVALGGYVIYRLKNLYQADQKAYQVALKAVDPKEAAWWGYASAVRGFRRKYILKNVYVRVDYGPYLDTYEAVATLQMPFQRFWKSIQPHHPILEHLAKEAGETLEQARDHILWGTMKYVKCPVPVEPSVGSYVAWGALQLTVPLTIGLFVLWKAS